MLALGAAGLAAFILTWGLLLSAGWGLRTYFRSSDAQVAAATALHEQLGCLEYFVAQLVPEGRKVRVRTFGDIYASQRTLGVLSLRDSVARGRSPWVLEVGAAVDAPPDQRCGDWGIRILRKP